MNREIKFRIWDNRQKSFIINDNSIHFDLWDWATQMSDCLIYPIDHVIFQQFTGLKDKSGKEIYDGDIVKIWHDSYTNRIRDYELAVVIWGWNKWELRVSSENSIKRYNRWFPVDEEYTEIIGNICEHPHMVRI
jgi:uncharacterized phage protein (TIGR01671 family)